MPEGDTVWLAASRLHDALAGGLLTITDFRVPALATADLRGRRVAEVRSRGKHLLLRLEPRESTAPWRPSGALTLHSHLRMDGAWHLYRPGERWRGGPRGQVRAVLATTDWTAVGYRLPVLELLPRDEEDSVVGHLGPDLLGPDWDASEALRRLTARETHELAPALLDQRNLAGIGNVYASELCFLAGVTPWTPVGEVTDLAGLLRTAKALLERNKTTSGQVTTGDPRPGRSHWVYGRSGRPCRRCGAPVRAAAQGQPPRQRLAYWCPGCQHGPAPR